jgi:hypothetical protein
MTANYDEAKQAMKTISENLEIIEREGIDLGVDVKKLKETLNSLFVEIVIDEAKK